MLLVFELVFFLAILLVSELIFCLEVNGVDSCHAAQDEVGSTACRPCPEGTFADHKGSIQCKTCRTGTYANTTGMVECYACPANTMNFQDANWIGGELEDFVPNKRENCIAKPGYYGAVGEPAVICPSGAVCCTCIEPTSLEAGLDRLHLIEDREYDQYCERCISGTVPVPYPLNGYARSEETGGEMNMIKCPRPESCRGALAIYVEEEVLLTTQLGDSTRSADAKLRTEPYTSGHCAEGYTGRLCKRCSTGYYDLGGDCFKCPENKELFTLGAVVLVVTAWVLLGVYMAGTYASLNLLLLFFQIGSMLQGFSMGWPASMETWITGVSIVNFDVDFISPQCVIRQYTYEWSFYLQLSLPVCILVISLAKYGVRHWWVTFILTVDDFEKKAMLISSYNSMLATVLSFQEIVYHSLCIKCFQPWMCDSMGSHLSYLVIAPDIECWKDRHLVMLAASSIGIVVYVFGTPVLFVTILHYGSSKNLLQQPEFRQRYGFLYVNFEMEWIYWELVMLLRRSLCAALLVLIAREPILQSLLAVIVLLVNLAAHYFARPFIRTELDLMEGTMLISLSYTALSGVAFYHDLSIVGGVDIWAILFFVMIGAQTCFALSVCCKEILTELRRDTALERLVSKIDEVVEMYDLRFVMYLQALKCHGTSSSDCNSQAYGDPGEVWINFNQLSSILSPLPDTIANECKDQNACRIFQQALALQRASVNTVVPLHQSGIFKSEADEGVLLTDTPGCHIQESVACTFLIQCIVAQYIDNLMAGGIRLLWKLFPYLDEDGNGSLSLSEVRPVWERKMPEGLSLQDQQFLFQIYFNNEVTCKEIVHRLHGLYDGTAGIVHMLMNSPEDSASKIVEILDRISKLLLEMSLPTIAEGDTNGSLMKKLPSRISDIISSIKPSSKVMALASNEATLHSAFILNQTDLLEQEIHEGRRNAIKNLFKGMKLMALQAWSKDVTNEDKLTMVYELGQHLQSLQTGSMGQEHQIQLHSTTAVSQFYNRLFRDFPYLMDWILEMSPDECAAADAVFDSMWRVNICVGGARVLSRKLAHKRRIL
eukprot:gene943-1458_t